MKKRFTILTAALALLAILAIPMGMKGQTRTEVTYSFSDHYTSNTVLDEVAIPIVDNTIQATFNKRNGGTATQYYTNGSAVRWYGGGTLDIVATNATMSQIEITYTQTANSVSTDVGQYSLSSSVGTWTGSASSVKFTQTGTSGHCRISAIKVTYTTSGGNPTAATPTFSPAAGLYTSAQNVTISTTTSGATIYYTTDGTNPTTSSSVYSDPISISANTTIKAMATATGYDNSSIATANYVFVDHAGTETDPYSVADAIDAIDAGTGLTDVYATGIISQVDSYNPTYHSITYWISEDGTTTSDQLEVYSGKGLDNTDFSSINDVEVGATVVVFGTLKKFNSTYEFDKNNYLVSYEAPIHDVATPTFSPAAGTYAEAQTVEISCETQGVDIFYTLDGTEPNDESTPYSGSITVSETTTIKAIAYAGDEASAIATATYHICSQANPYTVAQALAFNEYPANSIYVHGIVSTASTQAPTNNGELTYYISDNGEAANQLEVYKGKGLDNVAFTAQDDIQVGDIVTIYGNVKIYNNVKEFEQGNYLVEFERPASTEPSVTVSNATVSVTAEGGEGILTVTYENFTEIIADVYFCNADGQESSYEWITAGINDDNNVEYLVEPNEGEARTAYFKVFALDDNVEEVYSDLVTVNQAEYVAPVLDYATLPFEFDGGRADIATTSGLTQEGLDSDYSSSPKLKFKTTGTWVILHFNERPGTLTFDIKGNSFSGGTFTVQTSEDGVTYTDLENYTDANFGNTLQSEEFTNLGENVRYIKWIYTEKSSGNVALGNIALAEYTGPVASITVADATVSVPAEGAEGTLTVTYENITEIIADVYFCDADGQEFTYEWMTAEIDDDNNVEYLVEPNDGEARTAYFKVYAMDDEGELVYSNLVTVNQEAPVVPPTGDEYALYTGELVEGDYVICYNNTTWTAAMKNTVESGRLSYEEVTPDNDVVITNDATIVWHIAQSGDYWTIYSADANAYAAGTGVKNKAQMLDDGTDDLAMWTVTGTDAYDFVNKGNAAANVNAYLRNNTTYGFACYATGTGGPLSLYKKVESVTPSIDLAITGYGTSAGGYYLIASPLADNTDPQEVTNMLSNTYDLYRFNQDNTSEWENYKSHTDDFVIESGKAYLYANKNDVTLKFYGTAYSGEGTFGLSVSSTNTEGNGGRMNAVGNPFQISATVNRPYYKMNGEGTGVTECLEGTTVGPLEGILVDGSEDEDVTFTPTPGSKSNDDIELLYLNITQNDNSVIDRAIVRFDGGGQLLKYQLFEGTKVSVIKNNNDYAIARAEANGTMPLNFKAESNGTYTISVNAENVEMKTLTLIDNLTGNEVDLLSSAEYSFEATTDDAEDRFTLVYSKSGETKTYKLTITAEDFTTTSYAANNNMKISNAVNVDDETDTYEVKWVSSQVYQNGDGQMQWKRGEGRIYNISNMGTITDVTVTDISGEFCTYYGDYIEPAFYGYDGWPFFQTKTLNDAVGVSEKLEVTFDIEEGVTPTSFTVTFDAGEGTFVGNEDFPSTENTMPAGIYTLPTATREGYVFNGWLAANSNTPKIDTYTVYTDVAFTAQYTENGASGGNGGVDVLNREFTGVTGTTYTNWSDMEGESGAVYAGNSAGGNDAIQLRSTNNAGIITTASGGMVSKVVVSWNSNTAAGRTLNVYGKNVAYEATSDLYNDNKQGALLGTIVKGTSTELTVSDEYTFIGMRSNSGAMYLDEISITWVLPSNVATPTFSPAGGTYTEAQSVTISCDTEDAVIYYTTDGTTPDNNSTVYDGAITVSETTTIQAIAYVGTEASLVASATYTIVTPLTIAAVREQGTGAVMTMGIVTAVSSNSNGTTAYMQDETAAIVVYGNFTAEVGDEIQVEGTLTTYKGLLEIGTPTVTVLSQDNVVDPTYMTIEEINNDAEGDNDYQAMLVNIIDATVTSVGSSNTIAQGTNTITVYGSLGEVEVNDVITFTGNIGCYNTVQIVNPTNIEVQSNLPVFLTEGGDWNVADNWSTGVVPTIEDDVVLNANVTITGIAEANSIQQLNYTITIEDGGQLKFNEGPVEATVKKFVQGYGAGNEDEAAGYKLIHNPIRVTNTNQIEGLLTGNYDVYYWDETADGEEWQNIEDDDTYFDWSYIHGFLYANEEDVTLSYTGTLYNNSVHSRYEVTYNSGHAFSGLNLIGNLFVCEAYLTNPNATEALPYYRMNENGDGLTAVNNATPIAPMEAIFYYQAEDWAWVDFNRMAPEDKGSNLNMVVSQGQGTVDNAIVSFNNTNTLEKFSFREGSTKLYIPQNGKEYAVVYSEGVGEMPVNFKAEKNDTYTLSFSNDNVEFSYLHLIDNLTGADVDLLANPSYSFEAKNSDYASRFKLVFATGNNSESNDFAYISDSNIIVNGEGMLQVIDMTGRIVSTEQINGMARVNVNAAAGVYVLQLTNGESVKTQKIVIK